MKFIRTLIYVAFFLISLNFLILPGQAATTNIPTDAEELLKKTGIEINFNFTNKHLQKDNIYGKYYKLTLPVNAIIDLYLEGPKMSIYNKNMKLIENVRPDKTENGNYHYTSYSRYLEAGTYYIYLYSNTPLSVNMYGGYQQVYKEKEPNNNLQTAYDITNIIKVGEYFSKRFIGTISSSNDVDYYKFTTKNDATRIHFGLYFSGINGLATSSIALVDSKGKEIKYNIERNAEFEEFYVTVPKGTYYFKIKSTKQNIGRDYDLFVSMEKTILPINPKDVTVQNIIGNDTVTLNNLVKGREYTIYWNNGYKSFIASTTKTTVKIGQLGKSKGFISIYVCKKNSFECSDETKVAYGAEKIPTLLTKNVKITNKIGSKDKIVLKGLTKGVKYTIYSDSKLKKKLITYTATGTSKTLTVKLNDKAGKVYIVASKTGYKSTPPLKVSYKAQPTKALSAKNVKITNTKKQDIIKLSGLKKGTTYVIYKDAKKKTKLISFQATGTTKTVIVKQLGKSAGKIYITAKTPGYEVSAITTVSYSKEK